MANHCIHGFVKHIYGVTYYALLSVILMNCEIPSFMELVRVIKKRHGIHIFAAGILIFLSYSFINTVVHYGTSVSEPWSTEIIGNVYPGKEIISQNVRFDDLKVGTAYLKNISTILGNIPDDKKEGILHIKILENNNILAAANISIAEIEVGDWFQIPLGCMIQSGQEYQITYSVENANASEPCLFIQDDSQAARENGTLYVDGIEKSGAVANKYEYDDYIICTKTKISIMLIALILLQYMIFVFKEKTVRKQIIK